VDAKMMGTNGNKGQGTPVDNATATTHTSGPPASHVAQASGLNASGPTAPPPFSSPSLGVFSSTGTSITSNVLPQVLRVPPSLPTSQATSDSPVVTPELPTLRYAPSGSVALIRFAGNAFKSYTRQPPRVSQNTPTPLSQLVGNPMLGGATSLSVLSDAAAVVWQQLHPRPTGNLIAPNNPTAPPTLISQSRRKNISYNALAHSASQRGKLELLKERQVANSERLSLVKWSSADSFKKLHAFPVKQFLMVLLCIAAHHGLARKSFKDFKLLEKLELQDGEAIVGRASSAFKALLNCKARA